MNDEPLYPPKFANDDWLRQALAMNAEYWRVMELKQTDPERGEAQFQTLLDQMRQEKAERDARS
jgi:hypothetical protein